VAAWGIEFGLGWDRSTFPAGSLERTRRVRARGAFLHRRTDLARSGWEGVFAIETARRQATLRSDTTGTIAGTGLRGDERQRIVEVDMAGEIWLGAAWSLAGRTALRQVTGEGQPIPLSERYRFGGANSVRGYREDEFQGERIAHASVELRVGRAGRSRLYTFWDMGYFEFSALAPTPENPERRQQRSGTVRGFGWGLQTSTPGGDISLAIGFPGSVNFDDAKLHVSLLGAF
jgi:outer membrane protein assembly factor BamA